MSALALPGFANQWRRESAAWWSTSRWWVLAIVWTAVTNGLLAIALWIIPQIDTAAGGGSGSVVESAAQFTGLAGLVASIAVVIAMQGTLIDERRLGLLEWMLSKPLSRGALLLAKTAAHALGVVVAIVIVPWLGVLAQLSLARGELWPPGNWAAAAALLALLAVFNVAVVLAVSTLTWSRSLVIALPLAGIFGSDLLVVFLPQAFEALPWSLGRLAGPVLAEGVLVSAGPVVAAIAATLLLVGAAGWGLRRTEL